MKTLERIRNSARQALALGVALAMAGAAPRLALAATDLSDTPLASSSTASVKPNILFILDDSLSMDRGYMPDEMGSSTSKATYRNHLCNTIYYNPAITYTPPPQSADGTKFPNQDFADALVNGYDSGSSKKNLSSNFRADADQDGSGGSDSNQLAYYYVLSSGTAPASPLAAACRGSAPNRTNTTGGTDVVSGGGLTWSKRQVTATSGPGGTDERQNFANWYSYYRTRLMMMKAATGRSFITLTPSYRVGFITIDPGSPVSANRYLRIQDFEYAHKQDFLDKLYGQTSNFSTPLRQALARAGWIFAGKLDTGITNGIDVADDPVQYSCQQNFALLTTDGYWNGARGVDLNNNNVGNQDNDITVSPRPMWDGGYTSTRTTLFDRRTYFLSNSPSTCTAPKFRVRYNTTKHRRTQRLSGSTVVADTTTNLSGGTSGTLLCGCSAGCALPSTNPEEIVTSITVDPADGGGSINSLADVAQYYYQTDLRSTMENNVPSAGSGVEDDRAPWQHMTTFTLGLGIFGNLSFHSDYKTSTDQNKDFYKLRNGIINWPVPTDNTNTPFDEPARADDLWHTAVDGRGQAFSAANPDEVSTGLNATLAGVNARVASAAAAATSNLEPVAGDNFAYTASYETVRWVGDVEARAIDLQDGTVGATAIWSAKDELLKQVSNACDNRNILLYRGGASGNLVPFKLSTFACDLAGNPTGSAVTTLDPAEQAYFDTTELQQLTQYVSMTDGTSGTENQRTNAQGASLVNFLRGQRGNEGFVSGSATGFYRTRTHVLGDIVNAQPLFVKSPFARYVDAGYTAFKTAHASRTPMLYVASNDGMLHAFMADTGTEAWSFIPTMVLPNLFWLADEKYANLHKFYVDGTPVAADVYDPVTTSWRTIVVGGLNKGGTGFYALDVTDPAAPKGLWEFKHSSTCFDDTIPATHGADCNLGLSYGNPIVSKLSNGTWVVFVTSGYNNVSGDANDGKGYLYVLDANTGKILKKIGTGVGDAANPSGLGKINNWVNDGLSNNTTERVYGVDLQGNIWRFDVNGAPASGGTAVLLAQARDAGNNPQSITTKPELANVGSPPRPIVYVASGRYLGASDVGDTQVQTIYAIRDPLTSTPYTDLRTSLSQIAITNQTVGAVTQRVATCNANCASSDGWYADFPDSGERVNVDMRLQLGTLTVLSNVPQNSACTIGGYSYINFFDYANGLAVAGGDGGVVGLKLAESLAVGLNIVRLPDGKTVSITTTSDAQQRTVEIPISSPAITGRRMSWREIGE
jgi:type IV pilus assembly protein PilY1